MFKARERAFVLCPKMRNQIFRIPADFHVILEAVMIQSRNRCLDPLNPLTNNVFQEAVMRGDCAIVSVLLKYGLYARQNHRNAQGLTALQQAVFDGNMRLAVKLLEAGSDIEAKTANEWTALHIAAAVGEYEILCMLISNCADLLALTKNEELPIDLACNREIKVKLATEMTRIGYSELAMWYMRKLAAREGAFYVVSADALLGIACYGNESIEPVSSSNLMLMLQRNSSCREHSLVSLQDELQRNNSISLSCITSARGSPVPTNGNIKSPNSKPYARFQSPSSETMTFLSCSSGYLSEVIINPTTGEYTQVDKSPALSPAVSPMQTVRPTAGDLRLSKSLLSVNDDVELVEKSQSCSDTLNTVPEPHSKPEQLLQFDTLQRKPSKIELFIDYSLDADAEEDVNGRVNTGLGKQASQMKLSPVETGKSVKNLINASSQNLLESYTKSGISHEPPTTKSSGPYGTTTGSANSQLDTSTSSRNDSDAIVSSLALASSGKQITNLFSANYISAQAGNLPYESRALMRNNSFKNVRFTGDTDANEFCNCPNCKKMGYALSPDIRSSQKQDNSEKDSMFSSKPLPLSYPELNGYLLSPSAKQSYHFGAENDAKEMAAQSVCGPEFDRWKPRKRKRNLLSGLINIFKDTIKIHRSSSETEIRSDDSGIVFAVALRDKLKSKAIKQGSKAKLSNSLSGCSGNQQTPQYVGRSKSFTSSDVLPPPPTMFDDINDCDRYSCCIADSNCPDLHSTNQKSPVSMHEINTSTKGTRNLEADSARTCLNESSSSLQSKSCRMNTGIGIDNARCFAHDNDADSVASSERAPQYSLVPSSYGNSYDSQSLASDARISKLMSEDMSSAVHGELDHDCDFCATFAAVQNRGIHSAGSQRLMARPLFEKGGTAKLFWT